MFDSDESSNIFRDLDEILIDDSNIKQENESFGEDIPTIKQEDVDFAPDEEDVENQLMHIDDQLIRLDENIEDINGHLDVQFLNTATVATGDELLTEEQQNLLFGAMPEVMDPLHGWSLEDPNRYVMVTAFRAVLPKLFPHITNGNLVNVTVSKL